MGNPIISIGFLASGSRLRRIYEQLQLSGDKIYQQAGIDFKSSWFPVFYTLSVSGRPLTIMEITGQIAFSHITVKNILQELSAARLVRIVPNPADKRSKLISLTPKGLKLLDSLTPLWQQLSRALEELFTAGHPDILDILERIDRALDEQPLEERLIPAKKTNKR